jgi:predicted ATP-grasp superfamily ATP-dependent carboligase
MNTSAADSVHPAGPRAPAVLVLGKSITALGVVRSLARAGLTPFLLSADEGFVSFSRHCKLLPSGLSHSAGEDQLPALLERLSEPMVLVPCSDGWASAVRALPPELAGRYPASLAPPAALHGLIDKSAFAEALRVLEIPHPRTHALPSEADLTGLASDCFANAFLKPCESHAFLRRFDRKAFRIKDREEAIVRWREAHAAGLAMVLQEYIPGPPKAHYFVDGFMDQQGEIRARFARQRVRMDPPDFGNSTYMVSVPLEEVDAAVRSLDRLLHGIHYRGIFSAEFKRDPRDGLFKILEVNSRAWWYVGFATDCGVNVCEMAYRDALGLPVATVTRYAAGRACVYPHHDWRSWEHSDDRSLESLLRTLASWVGASQPIFRWDDPLPSLADSWAYLVAHWGRRDRP